MHLKNVEIFCEVATNRSFSKAAKSLQISQSSASQAVQSLEEHLAAQLIDRSTRPLELTSSGQVFLSGCRELLTGFRQIEEQIKGNQNQITGRVRVAAIYSVGLMRMERFLKQFSENNPGVDLQLTYAHPDDVYEQIQQDQVDLGILSFPKEGGDLSCFPWQKQEIVLVVPQDHRLSFRDKIEPSEINGEQFISLTSELKFSQKVKRWLRDSGVRVNVAHTFDNIENVKRAIEAGAGISLIPKPTVAREVALGTLKAIPLEGVCWVRPLGIVHRRHKQLSLAAKRFVEKLQNELEPEQTNDSNRSTSSQEALNAG